VQFCFAHEFHRVVPDRILTDNSIVALQNHDALLSTLKDAVLNKVSVQDWRDLGLRKFQRSADRLSVQNDILWCLSQEVMVPVVSFDVMVDIVLSVHVGMAHIGRHKLVDMTKQV
jgi:hypothetical protein